jgi:hypothetical protein
MVVKRRRRRGGRGGCCSFTERLTEGVSSASPWRWRWQALVMRESIMAAIDESMSLSFRPIVPAFNLAHSPRTVHSASAAAARAKFLGKLAALPFVTFVTLLHVGHL